MVKLFEQLGRDQKLGLGGRPLRPLGPLNTSKIFRICGNTVVLFPLVFELKDFYTNADPSTLIEDIKVCLISFSQFFDESFAPQFFI